MKKSATFLLVLMLLSVSQLFAQYFPSEVWHEGKLTLLSGDEIKGKIKYNLETDLAQVNIDNTIQTYSARKILFFEIFDETTSRYRQFYALPYDIRPSYKVPMLFEVLYENTVTLLCREVVVQENVPQYSYYSYYNYGNRFASRYRLDYEYFFLDKEGGIVKYNQKKEGLYEILHNNSSALEKYIKEHKLKPDRQRDLVRITAYYNSLINS